MTNAIAIHPENWDTLSWMAGCILENDPAAFFRYLEAGDKRFSFCVEPLDMLVEGSYYAESSEIVATHIEKVSRHFVCEKVTLAAELVDLIEDKLLAKINN